MKMLTLEEKAARHRLIKSIVNRRNKEKAARNLERRRNAEDMLYLKSKGVE
jgi:hypothetical protein